MAVFKGFPPEALTFFRGLKRNNNREWFQARKQFFEEKVRAPMVALVEVINAEFARVAPDFVTPPPKSIYRIYRDTRFSKDKTPYKDHIGALFIQRDLGKHTSAGFYMGVSPAGVEVAGGVYMPEPEQMLALRNLFAGRWEDFRAMTAGVRSFRRLAGELHGDQLARVPKGFPKEHPAQDLLRRKQWYWYVVLDAKLALGPGLKREVWKRFRAMLPVVEFMNGPLKERRKKQTREAMFL